MKQNGRQVPKVNVEEIVERTFPEFSVSVEDPMPGVRMLTLQTVSTPNRTITKYVFPFDVANAQDLGNKLSAPSIEVTSQMPGTEQ